MKLRLTIEVDYDADPEHYGTEDPTKAARVDEQTFRDDPYAALELVEHNEATFTVLPRRA